MTNLLSSHPETISQTEISSTLRHATDRVSDLMVSDGFHQHLLDRGVTLEDEDAYRYWEELAVFTAKEASDNSLSQLESQSLQLAGFLPNFISNKYLLEQHSAVPRSQQSPYDAKEVKNAKMTASVYNSLLRDFARNHPQDPDQLHASLLETSLATFGAESNDVLDFADKTIKTTLKGVKHELAFAAVLDRFNVNYRDTTTREDLQGRDLVVKINDHEIGVDVKASLTKVDAENRGSTNTAIATKANGDLVVYSLFEDKDFKRSFVPTDEALDLKSTVIAGSLYAAATEVIANK